MSCIPFLFPQSRIESRILHLFAVISFVHFNLETVSQLFFVLFPLKIFKEGYSIGNIAKGIVIALHGDRYYSCGEHSITQRVADYVV